MGGFAVNYNPYDLQCIHLAIRWHLKSTNEILQSPFKHEQIQYQVVVNEYVTESKGIYKFTLFLFKVIS